MVGFIFSLLEGHHNPCLQILLRTFRTKYAILLFILEGDNPDYIFQFFLVNLKKGTGTCVLLWVYLRDQITLLLVLFVIWWVLLRKHLILLLDYIPDYYYFVWLGKDIFSLHHNETIPTFIIWNSFYLPFRDPFLYFTLSILFMFHSRLSLYPLSNSSISLWFPISNYIFNIL